MFAPFEKVGLIIMDEEQEYSYKSESSPDIMQEKSQNSDAATIMPCLF